MIETFTLRNFQSHKNSTLELHRGVNVIVGDSDTGKSAIIRALYWTAFGKPAGNSIMRHNVIKPTTVEITAECGTLQKVRTEKAGYYVVNGETYKGFGNAIPQPVIQFLNLGEINFMRQLDPLFLLSKSGGELAQYLNKLISLDIIDHSLTNIKQSVNAEARNISACENNIHNLEKRLQEFDYLPELEKRIQALEKLETKYNKLHATKTQIETYIVSVAESQKQINNLNWVQKANKQIKHIADLNRHLQTVKANFLPLRNALSRYISAKTTADKHKPTKQLERAILSLSASFDKKQALEKRAKALKKAIDDYRTMVNITNKAKAALKAAEQEFELAKPETCPTCGQPWR